MNSKLKDTCRNVEKHSQYRAEPSSKGTVILPVPDAEKEVICPFDNATEMVCQYLTIGYMKDREIDTDASVLDFVSRYGMPRRNMRRLNVIEFSEDAQALYLHFAENAFAPYTDEPEWVLETEPVSALIKTADNEVVIEWQTPDLYTAVELAYTLLLCGKERRLGLCKYCGTPFTVKNPKTEFCSPACRNKYNVYKSREKNKKI